jgi:hypothetical protein
MVNGFRVHFAWSCILSAVHVSQRLVIAVKISGDIQTVPPNLAAPGNGAIVRPFQTQPRWRAVPEPQRWASMRVFCLITLLALTGCCSQEPRLRTVPWSYVAEVRQLPIEFSFDEIVTRTWTETSGQTIGLLNREVFQIGAPQPLEVLVATFGATNSNRLVCIDFYAARPTRDGKTYLLLCHDQGCPAFATKVRYEEQGKRAIFFISGEDQEEGSSRRFWRQYDYELNPKWQMIRGFSEFIGAPSR